MTWQHAGSHSHGAYAGLSIADQLRMGDRIRAAVVAESGITEEEILAKTAGGRQETRIVRARWQAIVRMRQADMSWSCIASALGYGNHQGPYHLLRRHGDLDEVQA